MSPNNDNSSIYLTHANGDPFPESDCPKAFNEYLSSVFTNECLDFVPFLSLKSFMSTCLRQRFLHRY